MHCLPHGSQNARKRTGLEQWQQSFWNRLIPRNYQSPPIKCQRLALKDYGISVLLYQFVQYEAFIVSLIVEWTFSIICVILAQDTSY